MKNFIKNREKKIATVCLLVLAFMIGHRCGVRDTECRITKAVLKNLEATEIIEF